MKKVQVIDSHTGGEPTRVVIGGGPDLGGGSAADKLKVFRERHDDFRRAVVNEPRGSDVLVGALLVEPADMSCVTGVIYFDNVTFLGMCGHGTIGLVVTLAHLGRIHPGEHRIETPVGVVTVVLHADGSVSLTNIPAYRKAKGATIDVPGLGKITGDVAWGGNWFFLVEQHGLALDLANVEKLTDASWRMRQAANAQGFPEVDHIVLLGRSRREETLTQIRNQSEPPHVGSYPVKMVSQNFVLCPGKAYDRSPCGTGTSARLACLAADGRLAEGEALVQESIVGTHFIGSFRWLDRAAGKIIPNITGMAHVTAEATLFLDEHDPFCWGIKQ
ncbi:MAG: proline racemase family protein [Verrucomicrobia bacterium]|nr:proline racemase family protein [Verrucomicrobiota bacterium]